MLPPFGSKTEDSLARLSPPASSVAQGEPGAPAELISLRAEPKSLSPVLQLSSRNSFAPRSCGSMNMAALQPIPLADGPPHFLQAILLNGAKAQAFPDTDRLS